MDSFYKNYIDLFDTIDDSIKKQRIIPALILIYSGIDSFSWLVSENEENQFTQWTKKWIIDRSSLPCNELDIYGARNGLLHQQTSESKLTKNEKAKQIFYSHGNANNELLNAVINNSEYKFKAVSVKIEELNSLFRKGVADSYVEVSKDPKRLEKFKTRAQKLFASIAT